MTTASVGFQCPECLASASQRVVTASELGPAQPLAILVIVGANIAMFFASESVQSIRTDLSLIARTGIPSIGVAEGEWWRLISGGFLHAGTIHLAFNMFIAWQLGGVIERVFGRLRFVVLYFTALLAGSLGAIIEAPNALIVGASGAVFGLMGAVAAFEWRQGRNPLQSSVGSLIVLNLAITFIGLVPGFGNVINISIGGHVGGLIGGALGALFISGLDPVKPSKPGPGTLATALLGVACGIGAYLYAGSTLTL